MVFCKRNTVPGFKRRDLIIEDHVVASRPHFLEPNEFVGQICAVSFTGKIGSGK